MNECFPDSFENKENSNINMNKMDEYTPKG